MDDILDSITDLLGPFNSRGFPNFSYDQGCTSSLATFHHIDGLDHQLKWYVGCQASGGVDLDL